MPVKNYEYKGFTICLSYGDWFVYGTSKKYYEIWLCRKI